MHFEQTTSTVKLGDVTLPIKDFKRVSDFDMTLPRGHTRTYTPGKGRYLINKEDGSETLEAEEWVKGNEYLMNRYVYQAKVSVSGSKDTQPGVVELPTELEIMSILKLPLEDRRSALNKLGKPVSTDKLWASIRFIRNKLLVQSDWTQLPDQSIDPVIVKQWEAYRQKLRDITLASNGDPLAIVWPVAPNGTTF